MRRISLIALLSIFALVGASCGGGGGDETVEDVQPTDTAPATTENVPTPDTAGTEGETLAQADGEEIIPPPPPPGSVPPELIESTDPNQRVQQIQANRTDPFGGVSVGRADVSRVPVEGDDDTTTTRRLPPAPGGRTAAAPGTGVDGRDQLDRDRLAPIPNLVGPNGNGGNGGQVQPVPPAPPPPPQPTLARAVRVMGVVQVGNMPYAIVQAPNEPTSRYVRPGQRLSNGEILVRRIEMNGPEPIVVLEQVGVEVRLAAGSGGPPPSDDGATTASLPLPTVPVN